MKTIYINKKAVEAADKALRKRIKKEMTTEEKVGKLVEDARTLGNILKIKLFSRESKFMKKFKVNEEVQKAFDRSDALEARIKERLSEKDYFTIKFLE